VPKRRRSGPTGGTVASGARLEGGRCAGSDVHFGTECTCQVRLGEVFCARFGRDPYIVSAMSEPRNEANSAAEPGTAQPQLHRKLGILNATSINMSNMIGIGPFITVPPILATLGGPQALLAWFAGAIIAIADGLVVSELGASLPSSGGAYVFLRDSFGRERWGKLMAWMFIWQFLFSGTLEIASGSIGMVQYLSYIWKGIAVHPWAIKFLAAGISALVMFSLYRKIQDIAKLMLILWITTLVTTGWVIITGLVKMNPHLAFDFPAGAFDLNWAFLIGLGNGTILVIYNYLGYNQVCYLGGEVKRPERTIPYAVILSILGVTVIDFLLSFSFVCVVPWREMVKEGSVAYNAVASVFMGRIYGEWAAIAISIMILFTAFASVFALMLGYSRVPYAAALDGAFFRWFGVLHPKGEFPHRSLVLVGVLCIIASFFGLVQIITGLILARILVVFCGQIVGLFLLRKYRPEVPRPFRMWLYPIPAVLALVGWLYSFASPAFRPGGWKFMLYAFGTIAAGLVAYFILAQKKREWPFAPRDVIPRS
jgi:amino acid transporter